MINTIDKPVLVEIWQDHNNVIEFNAQEHLDKYVEACIRLDKHKDLLHYSVFNNLANASKCFVEAQALLAERIMHVLYKALIACLPKTKYYIVYVKDSAKAKYQALSPDGSKTKLLFYAGIIPDSDIDRYVEVAKKHYKFVEARYSHSC